MRHFLQYWRTPSANAAEGKPLWFAGSFKYKARSISQGDVLWIVTLRNGKLRLVGQILIQKLITKSAFDLEYPGESPLEFAYFAVGDRSGPLVNERDINHLTSRLRFFGAADRITASGGKIGNSLQAIRELKPGTVKILQTFFEKKPTGLTEVCVANFTSIKRYSEGESKLVTHLRVERSPKLVSDKKQWALKELGALKCEVCGFHVRSFYGDEYGDYIECHHVLPLAKRNKAYKAELNDVMLLCPNCHAAAHSLPEAHTREHLMGLRKKLASRKLLHR